MNIKQALKAKGLLNELFDNLDKKKLDEVSELLEVSSDFLENELTKDEESTFLINEFGETSFLDRELICEFYKEVGKELKAVLYYANLPDSAEIENRIEAFRQAQNASLDVSSTTTNS